MGAVQRFEQRLGGLVEGAFAKVFKGEVQPVEIAGALRREADARRTIVDADRILTVNAFTVRLGDSDFARLEQWATPLTQELATMVREHAAEQRYSFVGPVQVALEHDPDVSTGTFRLDSAMAATPTSRGRSERSANGADVIVVPAGQAVPPTGVSPALPRPAVASGRPRLVVEGREIVLAQPVTVLGRGREADIRIDDPGVSRRHAELRAIDDDIEVVDTGSTNGTRVNGSPVARARLVDGDTIAVGSTTLRFARDRG